MIIEIIPVGVVPAGVLEGLLLPIEARFPGRHARVAEGLPRPAYAYVAARRQFQAQPILDQLATGAHTKRVLGVTDLDLFAPGLNFVFGQAQSGGPAAIMSLARLHPEFWGEPTNPAILQRRAIKEAIHELGHTYGLQHCPISTCVMHFSNTLGETDMKSDQFCQVHEEQVREALEAAYRRA